MTTLIIHIEEGVQAGKIAGAVRQLRGVSKVTVRKGEKSDHIIGLPYTRQACCTDLDRAETEYAAGNTLTSEEFKKQIDAW